MLSQIYEVTTPDEARSICEIGIDHIGVLVGKGEFPRELPVEAAARVAADTIPPSKFSGLLVLLRRALYDRDTTQSYLKR
jgi:phosphoribosylanthranilate isomerase